MKNFTKQIKLILYFATVLFIFPHEAGAAIPGISITLKDMVYSGGNMTFRADYSGVPTGAITSSGGPSFTPNYICFIPKLSPVTVGFGGISPIFLQFAPYNSYFFSHASSLCEAVPASGSGTKVFSFSPVSAGTTGVGMRVYMINAQWLSSFTYNSYSAGQVYGTTRSFPALGTPAYANPIPINYQDFAQVLITSVPPPPLSSVSLSVTPQSVVVGPVSDYSVGTGPHAVVYDSVNNAIWTSNRVGNSVTKLNASTGEIINTYNVGYTPRGLIYDVSTNSIWVANTNSNTVARLNASTGLIIGAYPVGSQPFDVVLDTNSNSIWVANYQSSNVTKLNATTGAFIQNYPAGSTPRAIAFDPATNSIWVSNFSVHTVTKLNATTGEIVGTYSVGTSPRNLLIDSVNNAVWVANGNSNTVSKLNVTTGSTIGTYAVDIDPYGVAYDSVTNAIWITGETSHVVTKLDAITGAVIGKFTAGNNPVGVTFDNINKLIWVANLNSNSVTKIDVNSSTTSLPKVSWGTTGPIVNCTAFTSWSGKKSITGGSQYIKIPAVPGEYVYSMNCFDNNTYKTSSTTVSVIPNSAPSAPVITGATSTFIGANETFSFFSTDPNGHQIRYGVDWDNNGTEDEWLPVSPSYMDSGISQSVTHKWITPAAITFKVLAQDTLGLKSAWATHNITVTAPASCDLPWGGTINSGESIPAFLQPLVGIPPSCSSHLISETRTCTNGTLSGSYTSRTCDDTILPPAAVNGSCGSAHGVAVSVAPASNLCSAGTASAVSGSGPWNWTCNGENGGTNASCSAPKKIQVKKFWQF